MPVLANGGIFAPEDIGRCLKATGADGVLVGEALLENPALFEGRRCGEDQAALAQEYLDIQPSAPADLKTVKQHLFAILYAHVQVHTDLRERLHKARTLDDMAAVVQECSSRPPQQRFPFGTECGDGYTSWYKRHTWEEHRKAARDAQKAAEAAKMLTDAEDISFEVQVDDETGLTY